MSTLKKNRLAIVLSFQQTRFEAVALASDFEANLAHIAGWGYAGVELAIRDPDLVDLETLEKQLIRFELQVPAIGTGQAWGEEGLSFTSSNVDNRSSAVSRIEHQIKLAQRLNALVIIGLIRGKTPQGQTKAKSMEYLMDCLCECVDFASENGVQLSLEPINRYETDLINTVQEGLDLINQIGSPNLNLLLDTFHMNIEEPDVLWSIAQANDHISHFHVADSNRWYPGAGHLDFESILKTLRSIGYSGWISGEFMPLPDANIAAEKNIALLRNLITT